MVTAGVGAVSGLATTGLGATNCRRRSERAAPLIIAISVPGSHVGDEIDAIITPIIIAQPHAAAVASVLSATGVHVDPAYAVLDVLSASASAVASSAAVGPVQRGSIRRNQHSNEKTVFMRRQTGKAESAVSLRSAQVAVFAR